LSATRGRKARAEPPPERWYAEGLQFTCTRCGECCRGPAPGYVEVDEAMIARLADHLGLEPDAFSRRYVRWMSSLGVYSLTEKKNGDCIFWSDDGGCTVYPVRPTQCRTFPFWPETLESPEAWDEYAADCPGMTRGKAGAGKRYLKDEIEVLSGGQGETGPSRARRLRRADDLNEATS
jgi:Fe-S-cluster containining protein